MFTGLFWRKVGLAFARAAVGAAVSGIVVALGPALQDGDVKASGLALAALAGVAVETGLRAAQAQFTHLESPDPDEVD